MENSFCGELTIKKEIIDKDAINAEFSNLSTKSVRVDSNALHRPTKRRFVKKDFKIKLETDLLKACNATVKESSQHSLNIKISKQMFRKEWLELPEFKNWLVEGLHPYHGFCTICNIRITAGKSELLSHSKSKKHLKNLVNREILEPPVDVTAIVDESGSTHLLRIIDLRSDSLSLPSIEMKRSMVEAPTGDTTFNSDSSVKKLEDSVAMMLKKESGLFFPTHIMANLVACLTHCQSRGSAIIAGTESDIVRSNKEALVKFGGLHFCPVEELDDGTFGIEMLENLLKETDLSFPLSCLVCFECAHARKGGRVPPLGWIDQLGRICSSEDSILLHCDGTRLINASLAFNIPPFRYINKCDSVTLAIDKSLGAPLGAVLVGKEVFIKRAAYIRDFIGGYIHQAGTFAAAGTFALEHAMANVDWDHEKAKAIAIDVSKEESSLVTVDLSVVETNVVHLLCCSNFLNATQLKDRLTTVSEDEPDMSEGDNVILLSEDLDRERLSLVLHNKLSHSDVRAAIRKLIFVIREFETSYGKRFQ